MALLVEDPHSLTEWDFPLCEDCHLSALLFLVREFPTKAVAKVLFQTNCQSGGQQPWEVLSFLSTPWEKFAPRATRDNPPAWVPTFREWLFRCLRGFVESFKTQSPRGALGCAAANSLAPFRPTSKVESQISKSCNASAVRLAAGCVRMH